MNVKKNLLPLGSIVLLEGGIQKLLVISRGINVQNKGRQFFFDYGGVPYPEGLVGDRMAYFNRDGIAKVVFEGYSDDDDKIMADNIERYLKENPDIEKGDAKTWEV